MSKLPTNTDICREDFAVRFHPRNLIFEERDGTDQVLKSRTTIVGQRSKKSKFLYKGFIHANIAADRVLDRKPAPNRPVRFDSHLPGTPTRTAKPKHTRLSAR